MGTIINNPPPMSKMPASSTGIRKFKWWYAIIIAGVLFFGAIAFLVLNVFLATGPAVDASEAFFTDISSGTDLQEVYDGTSIFFQDAMDYSSFESAANANTIMMDYSHMKLNSRHITADDTGTYAYLYGTIYALDGESSPVYVQVSKEGNEWKVAYIDFNTVYDDSL